MRYARSILLLAAAALPLQLLSRTPAEGTHALFPVQGALPFLPDSTAVQATDSVVQESAAWKAPALASSQSADDPFAVDMTVFPYSTPEAAAFMYTAADMPALYTGDPGIRIPLTTLHDREVTLPVELRWKGDALRVDEEASWVGLGWSLPIGGCVGYVAAGSNDATSTASPYSWADYAPLLSAPAGYEAGVRVVAGGADEAPLNVTSLREGRGEPDFYTVSLPGHSFSFYEQPWSPPGIPSYAVLGDEDSRYNVSRTNDGWAVTCGDGTTYQFAAQETHSGNGFSYVSAWYLTHVSSAKGGDITLTYTPHGVRLLPSYAEEVTSVDSLLYGSGTVHPPASMDGEGRRIYAFEDVDTSQPVLTEVSSAHWRLSLCTSPRTDLEGGMRLDSLVLSSLPDGTVRRHWAFSYDYTPAASTGSVFTASAYAGSRLRLLAVSDVTDPSCPATYAFAYDDSHLLPAKTSLSQDYLGFFNGSANTSLLPELANGGGCDRQCSAGHLTAGMLTRVTYPTGGSTEYVWEPHTFDSPDYRVSTVTGQVSAQVSDTHNTHETKSRQVVLKETFHGTLAYTFRCAPESNMQSLSGAFVRVFSPFSPSASTALITVPSGTAGTEYAGTHHLSLPAGTYVVQAFLPNNAEGAVTGSLDLRHTETTDCSVGGGARIRSVIQRDLGGRLAGHTDYDYTDDGTTTGRLLVPLQEETTDNHLFYEYTPKKQPVLKWTAYRLRTRSSRTDRSTAFSRRWLGGRTVGYSTVTAADYDSRGSLLRRTRSEYSNKALYDHGGGVWHLRDLDAGRLTRSMVYTPDSLPLRETLVTYAVQAAAMPMAAARYKNLWHGNDPAGKTFLSPTGEHPECEAVTYTYGQVWRTPARTVENIYGTDGTLLRTVTEDFAYDPFSKRISTALQDDGTLLRGHVLRYDSTAVLWEAPVREELLHGEHGAVPVAVRAVETDYGITGSCWKPLRKRSYLGSVLSHELSLSYDTKGRLRSQVRDSVERAVWLWGYGGQYPVAVVEGFSRQAVDSAATASLVASLATASATATTALLPVLRNRLKTAGIPVTTFTYEPLRGIASRTAPNGERTSWTYDRAGRTAAMLNHQGDTLCRYAYHLWSYNDGDTLNTVRRITLLEADGTPFLEETSWYDGLGRAVQQASSPGGEGGPWIHVLTSYLDGSRPHRRTVPVPILSGGLPTDSLSVAQAVAETYPDNNFYSEFFSNFSQSRDEAFYSTTWEYDALGRVTCIPGPGFLWHWANGHYPTVSYSVNDPEGLREHPKVSKAYETGVRRYDATPSFTGWWPAGSLERTVKTNEDGFSVETYTDLQGHVVLKRKLGTHYYYIRGKGESDTYYIYDGAGQLAWVLPSAVVEGQDSLGAVPQELLSRYAYHYEYDGRGALTCKTLPGRAPIRYKTDRAHRPVFTQDGLQAQEGLWSFCLRDAMGRVAVEGLTTATAAGRYDGRTVTAVYTGTGTLWGYGSTFPMDTACVLKACYYDGYASTSRLPSPHCYALQPQGITPADATGRLTGTRVRRLDTELTADMLTGAGTYDAETFYYDLYGNTVQHRATNHQGGYDFTSTSYTFTHTPLRRDHTHSVQGKPSHTQTTLYAYDGAGRTKEVRHSADGADTITVAGLAYDALGRLAANARNGIQANRTEYAYNIRGWVTKAEGTAFTELVTYEDPPYSNVEESRQRFSGNVTSSTFYTAADRIYDTDRTYGFYYLYDDWNRLSHGKFVMNNYDGNYYYNEKFKYDTMGNVTVLVRNGYLADMNNDIIDSLTYAYDGNQVVSIRNAKTGEDPWSAYTQRFHNGAEEETEYLYDANGNMVQDLNRGITHISYNAAGRPRRVSHEDGSYEEYLYDAEGRKLRVTYGQEALLQAMAQGEAEGEAQEAAFLSPFPLTAPPQPDDTAVEWTSGEQSSAWDTNQALTVTSLTSQVDYSGGMVYEDGWLRRMLFNGGFVWYHGTYVNAELYMGHCFFHTDHLGSVRVVTDEEGDLLQATHYYPSGAVIGDLSIRPTWQPYLFEGKEMDRTNRLDRTDHGARFYEAARMQWSQPDQLCELDYATSPYVFCHDNPASVIDPTGLTDYFTKDGEYDGSNSDGEDVIIRIKYGEDKIKEYPITDIDFRGKESVLQHIGEYYLSQYEKEPFTLRVETRSSDIPQNAVLSNDAGKASYSIYMDAKGKVHTSLGNLNNFHSIAYHESIHHVDPSTHDGMTGEVTTIMQQTKHSTWGNTSDTYKHSQASYAASSLNKAIHKGPVDISYYLEKLNNAFDEVATFSFENNQIEITITLNEAVTYGKKNK